MGLNFIYNISKMRALCSLFIFMGISLIGTAQNSNTSYFNAVQDTLNTLGKLVLNTATPQAKRELLNSQFKQTLYRSLQHDASVDCTFDSVKSLVRLVPNDKKMVLLNWEFPNDASADSKPRSICFSSCFLCADVTSRSVTVNSC